MLRLFAKQTTLPQIEADEERRGLRPRPPRDDIQCTATLCAGGAFHRVRLIDVSRHGCKVSMDQPRSAGERVQIALESYHSLAGLVRWYKDGRAGIQFANQLSDRQLATWKIAVTASRNRAAPCKVRRDFWGDRIRGGDPR